MEIDINSAHQAEDLQQWASLIRAFSSHPTELVLEPRPVYECGVLDGKTCVVTDSETDFNDNSPNDVPFSRHVVKELFDSCRSWPMLRQLRFHGVNFRQFEVEMRESLQEYASRVLPYVSVKDSPGNYMFLDDRDGVIRNQGGADGLRPHPDSNYPHMPRMSSSYDRVMTEANGDALFHNL
jgi:hypothetical protein